MSADYATRVAIEQRRRLVGSIMAYVERELYPGMLPDARTALRSKVLQSVGVYHDFVLDCLKAMLEPADGSVPNEAVIEALGDLATEVRMLRELREG